MQHRHTMSKSLRVPFVMLDRLQESKQFEQNFELLSELSVKLLQHGAILLSKVLEQVQRGPNRKWERVRVSTGLRRGGEINWWTKVRLMYQKEMVLAMKCSQQLLLFQN